MRLQDGPPPSQEPEFPRLGAPAGDFQLKGLEKGARVGLLPLDVAAGFTEGCPRKGTVVAGGLGDTGTQECSPHADRAPADRP